MPPKQPKRGPPPGLASFSISIPKADASTAVSVSPASSTASDSTASPLPPLGELEQTLSNPFEQIISDGGSSTEEGDGDGGRPNDRGKVKGKDRQGNSGNGNSSLSNRTGMLAMSRKAFRASMMMACHQTFGRLQVCSGEKKAEALVARAQRGAQPGRKPIAVSKHPCYIVQRTNPGSTSRSRFQITVAGSAGAKVRLPSRAFVAQLLASTGFLQPTWGAHLQKRFSF